MCQVSTKYMFYFLVFIFENLLLYNNNNNNKKPFQKIVKVHLKLQKV